MQNSEKVSETRNDDIVHQLEHDVERLNQRLTIHNLRLVDSYLKGKLQLLIQFYDPMLDVNYVAHLQRFRGAAKTGVLNKAQDSRISIRHGGSHLQCVDPCCGSMLETHCSREQETMLVDIVQSAESPQNVIPSSVWFESVETFNSVATGLFYYSTMCGRHVVSLVLSERKVDALSGGNSGVADHQLESQVVKGTPEIKQSVPSNSGDIRRDCRNSRYFEDLISIRVYLSEKEIAVFDNVKESDQCKLQVLDVLVGPFDFSFNSV